jgi:hypothetical protein
MNNQFPCKCGHDINDHELEYNTSTACLFDWTGHVPGCECPAFNPDNLKYLEQEYERTDKTN